MALVQDLFPSFLLSSGPVVARRAPFSRAAGVQSLWMPPAATRVSSWPSVRKVKTQREDEEPEARTHRTRAVKPSDVTAVAATIDGACRVQRVDPLTLRAFDRPTRLRQRFARPDGPSFLAGGTPERELLDRLAKPGPKSGEVGDDRRLAFEMLTAVTTEPTRLPGFWGEEPALDALRLDDIGDLGSGAMPEISWDGFLEWAGRALLADPARLPEETVPAAVAAIAASSGWRRALEACSSRLPEGPLGERSAGALASAALRAALEGVLLPGQVRWLIPIGDAKSDAKDAARQAAWRPALLALRAFREHGNEAGVVHLTAALVAGHFRWALRTEARRQDMPVEVPPWGAPPLSPAAQETLLQAVRWVSDTDPWRTGVPWPRDWGGPDGPLLATWLTRLLHGRTELARLALLDDRLCLAVVWGLLGRPQSALAQLDGWKTAPIFAEAREAVRRGIAGWPDLDLPRERPRGPELDDVFRTLSSTPDPSVVLGSPHWMLPGGRGAHTNRLMKQGRRDDARHLRTILDRPDVRRKLEPLWVLTGPEDTASVLALGRWLAPRAPSPSEKDWIAFLEWQCRTTLPATS
jgi:hypothetical protein